MRRLLFIAALLAGCGVNPLPVPPELGGEISGSTCLPCDGTIRVAGEPGSAKNADAVWLVNLDRQSEPLLVPVANDGSFEALMDALPGDEIRLQARRDELRSVPLDLVATVDAVLEPAARPLADCFVVEPELELDDATVGATSFATLTLSHDCDTSLTIDSIALRAPAPAFEIAAPVAPFVLAPGETTTVTIQLTPEAAGLVEEVLLIEVSSPEPDRRPVTLFGIAD
ncbi:MAG: hypothetical protein HOW73_42110 [Polyangiaceae bacterium]|nr:hypothetical protein [Polyangiaceae bacterium]